MNYGGPQVMHSRAQASAVFSGLVRVAHWMRHKTLASRGGGLGRGGTLRRVMEPSGPSVSIDVTVLVLEAVAWNRTYWRKLNAGALDQPHAKVIVGDAVELVSSSRSGYFDALLLDLERGPMAMVAAGNPRLYKKVGLQAVRPAGRAVFWWARPDDVFLTRSSPAKLKVAAVPAKSAREQKASVLQALRRRTH